MSKNSKLNVLGVMTGTSMDGVDISLINTNGTDFVKIKYEVCFLYVSVMKQQLYFYLKNFVIHISNNFILDCPYF